MDLAAHRCKGSAVAASGRRRQAGKFGEELLHTALQSLVPPTEAVQERPDVDGLVRQAPGQRLCPVKAAAPPGAPHHWLRWCSIPAVLAAIGAPSTHT